MAILLSNGTYLNSTGTQDSRGFPLLIDDSGRLYTNQKGAYIAGGMANGNSVQFNNILSTLNARGDSESSQLLTNLKNQFSASLPPQDAFKVTPLSDFLPGSRQDASTYFAPDRKLLEDSLKLVEEQAREQKNLSFGQRQENLTAFTGINDRNFAATLERAQSGYAGKGTFTSGFRNKGIDQTFQANQDTVDTQKRDFSQFVAQQDLSFGQTVAQNEIKKRQGELAIQRDEENKAQQEALAKFNEQITKDTALVGSFADFLGNKAAA